MNTLDKIEKFKYRYLIVNTNQYVNLQSKYTHLKNEKPPYPVAYCIIDWEKGIPVIYSAQQMKNKTFTLYNGGRKKIGGYDLSFLEPYKVSDVSFLLQSDKVSPNIGSIEHIYAIDHIWLAYVYKTKSNTLRMCLNKNLFGEHKLIGSRMMNLNEILLSLPKD